MDDSLQKVAVANSTSSDMVFGRTSCPLPSNIKSCLTRSETTGHIQMKQEEESRELARKVKFNQVSIRSYDQTVCRNPAVSSGPPIGLDWEYVDEGESPVDKFEESRSTLRRSKHELLVPHPVRVSKLRKDWDVSQEDLRAAIQDVKRSQKQRRASHAMAEFQATEELLEKAGRFIRRLRKKTSSKAEQEALWENARLLAQEKSKENSTSLATERCE